jgi:hypothetical protein
MDNTSSIEPWWDTEFELPPAPKSPASEVAEYLEDVIVSNYFYEEGWTMSELEQRRTLRDICEKNKWPWPQVSRALRKDRTARIVNRAQAVGEVEHTTSGIPIYRDRFPEPQPICPYKKRWFHLGFFAAGVGDKLCGGPTCKKCAPKVIEQLLMRIRFRIRPLEVVYLGQVEWDDNLTGRLGQRRLDHDINSFTYRDVNDVVTIVGDKPLQGKRPRAAPTSSQEMSPQETVTFLIDPVLWIPGHVSHHFSEGWAFPSKDDPTSGEHVSLDGLNDDQVEEFVQKAAIIVRTRYRIEPGVEPVPVKYWLELRLILLQLRAAIVKRG